MTLAPATREVLIPTPGRLADIVHVELSTGARTDTTYGTDTYGSWDYGGKQAWERWDCDITSLNMFRGRQAKLERNSPGICNFTAIQVVPAAWMTTPPTGRPARIITSTGRLVFYGVIEVADLSREYGQAEWSVTVLDDLARLGRLQVATLNRPAEDLRVRLNALLTAAAVPFQYPTPNWFAFVQAVAGSDRKVLDEMGIAIDTWRWSDNTFPAGGAFVGMGGASALIDRRGVFSVSAPTLPPSLEGNAHYNFPWRISPDPAAHPYTAQTWLGDALHAEYSADLADLRNQMTFSNAGGTARTYEDAASLAQYGARSYQRMDLIAAAGGIEHNPDDALDQWGTQAMSPTPALRWRAVTVDCWNRPAGAVPLEYLLGELDVLHFVEVSLPDQDDTGGDIAVKPDRPLGWTEGSGTLIYGLAWDLSDREAILTLTLDTPVIRTA